MIFAHSIFRKIINNIDNIESIDIIQYDFSPDIINDDDLTGSQGKLIDLAKKFNEKTKLPFWDSLFLLSFKKPQKNISLILRKSIRKNTLYDTESIAISEYSATINKYLDSNKNYAFQSIVHCSDGDFHLPMLDFVIPVSKNNQKTVLEVCKIISPMGGYLLISGSSYHFYGKNLMTNSQATVFLATAALFANIIDRNWVSHQIIDGSSKLRFTKKNQVFPYLVEEY